MKLYPSGMDIPVTVFESEQSRLSWRGEVSTLERCYIV